MKNFQPLVIVLLFLINVSPVFAQTDPLSEPWLDTNTQIVIDAYGLNKLDFKKVLTDKRVAGIIHKATEGLKKPDKKYHERKITTTKYGFLCGSYHLGKNGKPIEQADHYLKTVGDFSNELLALDLETLDKNHMTLKEAEVFINRIYEKTGRYPLVYTNHQVLTTINKNYDKNSIFGKCQYWYARFRKRVPYFDTKIWDSYFLWQFSCEINCKKTGTCLYNVPGTRYDMDVNVFNGSYEELKNAWLGGKQ